MSNTDVVQRPSSVSVVVALTWIAAFLDLVGGAVLVFFASSEDIQAATGASQGAITTAGWVTLAVGILVAVVAIRLGEGSSGARLLVTALMVVRAGAAVWVLVVAGTHGGTESIVTLALSVAVLYLLWSGPANTWFAASR